MKKLALVAILSALVAAPVQGAGRDTWPTLEECVAWAESAGSGSDGTFTYVCSPTADGSWELIWSKTSSTREKPTRGGQGLLRRGGSR